MRTLRVIDVPITCLLIAEAHSLSQPSDVTRRAFIGRSSSKLVATTAGSYFSLLLLGNRGANAASGAAQQALSLEDLKSNVKQARQQLDSVPQLIKEEKWDSVRAVLITPPLSDCWAKTARPLLPSYATAIGDADGDELGVLEAKEDAISHLRYLDMAAYNNNFNPIKTEGETGATRELVRSYYEDPTNEWKASVQAMDELVKLGELN